ncbi:DUF551 domain-containing protein [Enterobacter cloacae complex sp. OE43NF]|uniref:DUF551 domain-containing protein n=1 Tax=Enterobacter cloacae complex sp. OE43NF TaxID=2945081 RepID=UPI002021BB19|nr:DUF551 domain-containing protein [Enterobacter cloacae complex sp. OE43NF]MCL7671955.1 DUF551 domain-containing protein [Enterobacter cloacae complex sp. OE43NF]
MSTITKEFTKEQLQQIIETDHVQCGEASSLARIALASLEAEPAIHRWRRVTSEPYGPYPWHYGDFIGFSKPVDGIEDEYFYSAPPAPAPAPAKAEPVAWLWSHRKHPSEVSLVRPEDDERAEGAHWSGWSCQALYAAQPASAAMKDHQIRELVNELRDIAVEYHGTQQLRERIARTIRAAMLQGAEPVQGWIPCSDRMPTKNDRVLIFINFNSDTVPPSTHDAQFTGSTFRRGNATVNVFPLEDGYGVTHWMPLPAAPQQEA